MRGRLLGSLPCAPSSHLRRSNVLVTRTAGCATPNATIGGDVGSYYSAAITPPVGPFLIRSSHNRSWRYFSSSSSSSSSPPQSAISKSDESEEQWKKRCEALLHDNVSAAPKARKFNIVLADLRKFRERPWAADYASKLLEKMWEAHNAGMEGMMPTKVTYNRIIDIFANSPNTATRSKAIGYHKELEEMYEKKGDVKLKPDVISYTTLIDAWSKSGGRGVGEKAEATLHKMQEMYEGGDANVKPNIWSFNTVLNCWAKEGNGERAEAILSHMEELACHPGFEDIRPNTITYCVVIDAWARSGKRGAGEKAEALLNKMQEMYEGGDANVKPNIWSFNTVLNCWAKEGNGERAEAILSHMEKLMHHPGFEDIRPNTITYCVVIDALARSGKRGAGEKAEGILHKMQNMSEKGDANVKPNIQSFGAVLNCWAKEGNGERAEAILSHMEKLMLHPGYEDLRPDFIAYNTVIDAWARSGKVNAGEKAEAILHKMQVKSERGDTSVKPTIQSFGAVLNCWAKEGNGERAEAILSHMEKLMLHPRYEDLRPNTIIYSTVIDAWANSDSEVGIEKAEAILYKMKKMKEDGVADAAPSRITYIAVMSAYHKSKKDTFNKAVALLKEMESNTSFGPDSFTYTTFLNILSKSKHPKKAMFAKNILKAMKRNPNLHPDNYTYVAILRTCAYLTAKDRELRRHALILARDVLTEAQESTSIHLSPHTYGFYFRAISNLSSGEELHRLLKRSFEDCCKEGLLDDNTLRSFCQSAPSPLMKELLKVDVPLDRLKVKDLPASWSRNTGYRRKAHRKTA